MRASFPSLGIRLWERQTPASDYQGMEPLPFFPRHRSVPSATWKTTKFLHIPHTRLSLSLFFLLSSRPPPPPLFLPSFNLGFPDDLRSVPSTPRLARKNCNPRASPIPIIIPIPSAQQGPGSSLCSIRQTQPFLGRNANEEKRREERERTRRTRRITEALSRKLPTREARYRRLASKGVVRSPPGHPSSKRGSKMKATGRRVLDRARGVVSRYFL